MAEKFQIGPSSWVYGQERYDEYLSHPKCAIEGCEWRVWWQNGTMDGAFPEEYRKYCFTDAYWLELAERDKEDGRGVVVEEKTFSPPFGERIRRVHYKLPQELISHDPASFRGFGGHLWKIKLYGKTGALGDRDRIVETNNLWYQGDIPEHHYDLFPVNAEFVK